MLRLAQWCRLHPNRNFSTPPLKKMKIRPCYIDVFKKAISNIADVKKIPIIIDVLQNVADIELFRLCGRSGQQDLLYHITLKGI
jgi:hypothetical protein